jgi:hypothetical protein
MKRLFLILIFSSTLSLLNGQISDSLLAKRPINSINFSILGNGSRVAFYYEHMFRIKPWFFISGAFGFGYSEEENLFFIGTPPPPHKYTTLSHFVSANMGKNKCFVEFGIAGNLFPGEYMIIPMGGFRWQPLRTGKLNFRVYGSYPIGGVRSVDILFIPVGVSAGICF